MIHETGLFIMIVVMTLLALGTLSENIQRRENKIAKDLRETYERLSP